MMKSAGKKASGIPTPSDNDVLFGRGTKIQNHPGNVNYRRIIESRRRHYVQAKKTHLKDHLARQIFSAMGEMTPPGRFLKKESDGMYYVQDKEVTIVKIKQALRENAVEIKDKIEIASLAKRNSGYPPRPLERSIHKETTVIKLPSSLLAQEMKPRNPPSQPNVQTEIDNGNQKPAAASSAAYEKVTFHNDVIPSSKGDIIDPDMSHVVKLLLKASTEDSEDSPNNGEMSKKY